MLSRQKRQMQHKIQNYHLKRWKILIFLLCRGQWATIKLTCYKYKDFYQGATNSTDCQNYSPYVSLQTALMKTFTSDNYAFITLHCYLIALIRHTDNCINVSDIPFLYFALAVSLQTLFKWTSMIMLVNLVRKCWSGFIQWTIHYKYLFSFLFNLVALC